MQSSFSGVKIIESKHLPKTRLVQIRKPRSKKVRVQKKWRKDRRNWIEVDCS